jgi:hypothetical protein
MIDPPGTFRGCGPVTFLREVSSRRQAKWTFLSRSGSSASRHYGDLIFNQPSADYGCNLHIGTRQCLGQPRHVGVTNERGPISRIPCPSGSSLFHRNSGRLPLLSDRPHEKLEWSGGSPLKGPLSILRDTIQQPLIGPHEGRPRRGVPRASQLLWQPCVTFSSANPATAIASTPAKEVAAAIGVGSGRPDLQCTGPCG